jgi:hypothetical protein
MDGVGHVRWSVSVGLMLSFRVFDGCMASRACCRGVNAVGLLGFGLGSGVLLWEDYMHGFCGG